MNYYFTGILILLFCLLSLCMRPPYTINTDYKEYLEEKRRQSEEIRKDR